MTMRLPYKRDELGRASDYGSFSGLNTHVAAYVLM